MNGAHPSVESVLATAACAVTAGMPTDDSWRLVHQALRLGRALATQNRAVPLPIMLDVAAAGRRGHSGAFPAADIVADHNRRYCSWVIDLHRAARGLLDHPAYVRHIRSHDDLAGFLPLLHHAWPASANGEAAWFAYVYEMLLDQPDSVRTRWEAGRTTETSAWAWCSQIRAIRDFRLPLLQALYFPRADQRLGQYLHHFDHAAGRFYLDTRNAYLLEDQAQRILSLRQRRPWPQSWPLTESYEDVDPRFGAPSLAALTGDSIEQIWHDLRTKPRINNPPPFRPPQAVDVHLGWRIGSISSTQTLEPQMEWKWFSDVVAPPFSPLSHSALLQGLVALAVDDWRHFLDPLPVDFYLHREFPRIPTEDRSTRHSGGSATRVPEPNRAFAGPTGNRWRDLWNGKTDCLPPWDVVTLLFDHIGRDTVYLASRQNENPPLPPIPERSESENESNSWWCLFVCEADLPEFGFKAIRQCDGRTLWRYGRRSQGWQRGPYTHVVILDSEAPGDPATQPDGHLCQIVERADSIEFLPLHRRVAQGPFPYAPLRVHLVDVLIDQLQRSM